MAGDWTTAPDLAGVREPDALAKLPEAEQAAWQAFWADMDAASGRSASREVDSDPFSAADRHRSQKHHAAAAGSYALSLARPGLSENAKISTRYKGALGAAQAGSGLGDDDPKPDADARAGLRRQSLGWLKENLKFRIENMASEPAKTVPAARNAALLWKGNDELACVREPNALAKFPEAERAAWQAFWAEVDAMQARTEAALAKP